jgi:2-alkyl-3-oxoalkanoate reductase
MRALVTGAGGFLGRYIVEALVARGDQVRGLARSNYPELTALGVEMDRGDLRDAKSVDAACEGIDCVFHTAARPGIDMQWRLYDEVNRLGTLHVINACRAAGAGRLVYTSSPSVVFAGVDQSGCDERVPYDFEWMQHNRAYYSLTKALAEEAVLAANGDALRTCALRPHLIWGPRDGHLIPRLIARARSGRLRRVGEGANLVDMINVENAAEAHLRAADALGETASAVGGKAYFLSQGEPVNCWQWINEILALVDLPPVQKSISLTAARRIGFVCETLWRVARLTGEPPMTRFLASQLATSHWFDISAARRDFGYRPRVSTTEGMERLGEWLRRGN